MDNCSKLIMGIALTLGLYSCGSRPAPQGHNEQVAVQEEKPTGELAELLEEVNLENLGDGIQVFTTKIGNDPDKHHLTASFPVTKEGYINEAEAGFAQKYIEEFKQEAQRLGNSGTGAIDYNQHFLVTHHNGSLLNFLYTRSTSLGNNYDDQYISRIYDLSSKKRLSVRELFSSQEAFGTFAQEARKLAQEVVRKRLEDSGSYTNETELSQVWASILEQIEEGTQPTDSNYDGLYIDEQKQWTVIFDKYQIAGGYLGEFKISIPSDLITPYLNEDIIALTGAKTQVAETPEPQPKSPEKNATTDSQGPMVALTFDDGPSVYTERLLDILAKEDVKATFFVIGKSAAVQSKTIKRMAEEGHNIGNHSYDHKNFAKISTEEARRQIELTDQAIQTATNSRPAYFRFPYGAYTSDKLPLVNRPIIGWNIDPLDWKYKNAERVAMEMTKAKDRAIILGHDIHKTTVDAIPEVIHTLKAKGYRFVSLDQLFEGKDIKANKIYTSGK